VWCSHIVAHANGDHNITGRAGYLPNLVDEIRTSRQVFNGILMALTPSTVNTSVLFSNKLLNCPARFDIVAVANDPAKEMRDI
jgi:hypothetical protein